MYQEKPDNSNQKVAAILVVLVVIGLLASGVIVYGNNQNSQNAAVSSITSATTTPVASTSPTSSSTPSTSSSATSTSSYKDGTFSASSDYYVPHGSEGIKVTLTLKNGVVTNSSIQNTEYNGQSAQYQESFAYEYKSQVVGKSISSINLNYVAGASDTTQGFNDALQQIKTEAQA